MTRERYRFFVSLSVRADAKGKPWLKDDVGHYYYRVLSHALVQIAFNEEQKTCPRQLRFLWMPGKRVDNHDRISDMKWEPRRTKYHDPGIPNYDEPDEELLQSIAMRRWKNTKLKREKKNDPA